MIIITAQYLERPGAALDVARSGEPVLIVRDSEPGPVQPVAMLVPVEMDDDTGAIISAVPEFIDAREHAEHARAEGRTVPAEEALATLEKMDQEATQ